PYYYGSRRKKKALVAGDEPQVSEYVKRARLMELDSHSSAAESYRALRTGLLLSSAGNPPKKILITSVRSSEGKTTTSTNVAISLSQLGSSVLLIDCDLRKPSVHTAFAVSTERGLSTYLAQGAALSDVTQNVSKHLDLIPAGPVPPNPS